jgi:hypothetical protein
MIELPEYAHVVRGLSPGEHPFLQFLPGVQESPAIRRIASAATPADRLLTNARVRLEPGDGYIWVDDEAPAIVLVEQYYRRGAALDLYLDLLHELTHLRQLAEGHNLWDETLAYVDRPTEIEGYAVAVEEGLRLGMSREDVVHHLANPWMMPADVRRLLGHIERFLGNRSPRRTCGDATGA